MFPRGIVMIGLIATLGFTALAGAAVTLGERLPRTELAYVAFPEMDAEIFVYDAARGLRHNLTDNPGYDLSPAWSPDGREIAFVSDRDGGLHIFVIDASGRNLRRLTPPGRVFEGARWSRDGQRIFVIARGAPLPDVFAVHPDGAGFELISSGTDNPTGIMMELGLDTATTGNWMQSPVDSRELSIDFIGGADWGLFLKDGVDGPLTLLASLGFLYGDGVSWSPDGKRITYLSTSAGQTDLYLIEPWPGAQPVRLTADRAYERSPVWRPLAAGS